MPWASAHPWVPPTLSNRCPGVGHFLPKLRPEAFGFALGLSGPPPPSRSSAWAAPAIHGRLQGDAAPLRCQRSPTALCARASRIVNVHKSGPARARVGK
jgi:hypothetical protein